MKIGRNLYLDRLIQHKHNGLVKVITGVRRCGKSYLLFTLFYEHLITCGVREENIIKLALDDYGNKALLNPDALYNYVKNKITGTNDTHYILLDEIQLVSDFESVINGFLHLPNVDIYVTGSNSKFLSSDIITEFRGRGDEIRVYPLNFSEFYSVHGGDFNQAWLTYCNYGGMPLCVDMETPQEKARYLTGLFETTYVADIINRYKLRGNNEINELTDMVASSIGSLTNPTKLANAFSSEKKKISVNTVTSYLEYLQDSFLIDKAVRFDIKGKRYINTPSKYYFVDMGLRNARLSFRQQEYGHIMENVIYNELKLRGYAVDVGLVECNGKENGVSVRKQLEVDFVVNDGNRRYYIQCAYTMPTAEKLKQEQASLLNINDAFRKIIIVNEQVLTGYNQDGILVISLSDFLFALEQVLNF